MKKTRFMGAVAAALVAGLVLGTLGSAMATAPKAATGATVAKTTLPAGCGLGVGRSARADGGRLIDVVASLTGKTLAEVQAERASGKTLSQIANAAGVSDAKVVDKAVEVRKTALAAAVKAGTVTQAQTDAALDTMRDRLTERLDATSTACGSGYGRGGQGAGRGAGAGYRGQGACMGTVAD